jgi:outer membrane protein TolC
MKLLLHVIVVGSFTLSLAAQVYGDTPPAPAPSPTPGTFEVNPTTIKKQLIEGSLTITQALDQVKDAKYQADIARRDLFPQLNLNGMIAAASGFFLSAVQFMLPFLAPSNWSNYYAQTDTFEADKITFLVTELNTYSSDLALYYTIVADQEFAEVYQSNADDLKQIAHLKELQLANGTEDPLDLAQTQTQADNAVVAASRARYTAVQEVETMRAALSIDSKLTLNLDRVNEAPSTLETMDDQTAIARALAIAPENQQIQLMIKAAQANVTKNKWAWFDSATVGSNASTQNTSLSKPAGGLGATFGAAEFSEVDLAKQGVIEVGRLQTQLVQANVQAIKTALDGFKEAKIQADAATDEENKAKQSYGIQKLRFAQGLIGFTDLLTALTQITNASIDRIMAVEGLNMQRVVLSRAGLENEFTGIKGCAAQSAPKKKQNLSLDQLCKQAN